MADSKKFLSLEGLQQYDELIKQYIDDTSFDLVSGSNNLVVAYDATLGKTKISSNILNRASITEVVAPEGEEEGYYALAFDGKELAYRFEYDQQIADIKTQINRVATFDEIQALFS